MVWTQISVYTWYLLTCISDGSLVIRFKGEVFDFNILFAISVLHVDKMRTSHKEVRFCLIFLLPVEFSLLFSLAAVLTEFCMHDSHALHLFI